MTDLEITKACAEAMELEWVWDGPEIRYRSSNARDAKTHVPIYQGTYEPLHDDAQAMALVKKLGLSVWVGTAGVWVCEAGRQPGVVKSGVVSDDLNRAICETAAKMQKAKL